MGKIIGCTGRHYRNKELGRYAFTLDEMIKLSKYFNKSLDYIFLGNTHQNGE